VNFKKPKIVFSDFDGTLTLGSELTTSFYDIISLLEKNNIPLVIVTGRSKSWAHFLLSHFPTIHYVITEGGGVISGKHRVNGRFKLWDKLLVPRSEVTELEALAKKLINEFPEIEMSVDTFGRESDRAIELPYLLENPIDAEKIKTFLKNHSINFSISNVHLNFWCGEISKIKSIKYFMDEYYKDLDLSETVFFGDSLNDETVFKGHPHTVGVSNVSKVIDQLESKPAVILEGEENRGPKGVYSYLTTSLK
jgi:HAD superfamily hydrolase (TIGR01484 family)